MKGKHREKDHALADLFNTLHICSIAYLRFMARLKNEAYANAFSENLRKVRNAEGLSLNELGSLSKLDLATIQRIEKTNGNVTISTLLALAKGLNVHPQDLLNFDHGRFLKSDKKQIMKS